MISAILAVIGMVASIYQGVKTKQAADEEAAAIAFEGDIAQAESEIAGDEAERQARERGRAQRLAFLKSGVNLEGSPLLVEAEQIQEGIKEANSIRKRGRAQSILAKSRAKILKRKGRAALIAGFGGAAAAGSKATKTSSPSPSTTASTSPVQNVNVLPKQSGVLQSDTSHLRRV